jgi:hypothetical protein
MTAILTQANEAAEVARDAFAAGDLVTSIAALQLAAQLVQLARIFERAKS